MFNPLSANHTKWPNRLKQLVGPCRRIVWVGFDHFLGLATKSVFFVSLNCFVDHGMENSSSAGKICPWLAKKDARTLYLTCPKLYISYGRRNSPKKEKIYWVIVLGWCLVLPNFSNTPLWQVLPDFTPVLSSNFFATLITSGHCYLVDFE